jgi:hypothetical protein
MLTRFTTLCIHFVHKTPGLFVYWLVNEIPYSMWDKNLQTFLVRIRICFTLDNLVLFSLPFVGKANIVGTADGFSVLRFLKPGITSAFGSKQSGAKYALQTYVFARSRGFSRRKLRNQTLLSGPLATYDNLYLFLWSFDCHLYTKAQ